MKSLFVQNSDIGVMPFGHAPINPTICVLGTPRSGTSMVAGLLRIMGVDMGNHVWSGNNEDLEFLIHNGRNTFQEKEYLSQKLFIQKISKVIAERNKQKEFWGWKDPISFLYIEQIVELLRKPVFIVVMRDPAAVSMREMFHNKHELILYPAYLKRTMLEQLKIIQFVTNQKKPYLIISYEKSLYLPGATCEKLFEFLNIKTSQPVYEKMIDLIELRRPVKISPEDIEGTLREAQDYIKSGL